MTLHCDSRGHGTPPVLLESGLAATSLSWALVHDKLSAVAQTITYDRAGLGWSTKSKASLSLTSILDDLSHLLYAQVGNRPAVLVGHSFGALIVRSFAAQHPERVAALVLVDPVSLDHWANCNASDRQRLALGAKLARRGAFLAQLGVVRLCLSALVSGRRTLPRLVARTSGGKGTNLVNRLVGEMSRLPPEQWPALIAHWSRPGSFRTMAAYLDNLEACAQAAQAAALPAHIPLTILSASTATEAELRERDGWTAENFRGIHIKVPDCTHWIQLQRPEVVIEAVLETCKQVPGNP